MPEQQNNAVTKLADEIIFWQPANPQGDIDGTKRDTKEILDLAKDCKLQCSLMIDLSKSEMPNLEQKKYIAKAGKKYKFKKVAVYGYTWRLKLVVDFIVKLVGSVNVQLFKTKQQATNWIKK